MLGIEDFVNKFVEIKVVFVHIFRIKDRKERWKRGFNSSDELKILIYV